ncbi:MAG: GNAT family N-acetyltransferase [bacterium]
MPLTVEIRDTLADITADAWDALVGPDGCPFFEHAFLRSMERAGCVGPGTGWSPRYVIARRGGDPVGALAMYRKDDSYGEFIFDWAWADAAHRAGMPYYPKLLVAAPFSPVGGRRFLVPRDEAPEVREALLVGAREMVAREPATGLHLLYVTEEEADFLERRDFVVRHTYQFHWQNEGYATFDDFLERFRSKRRNQIKRERRQIEESGVTTRVIEGDAIDDHAIDLAWRFYHTTVDKFFWGRRYLNRELFRLLAETWRDRLVLIVAEKDGEVVGGTVNAQKAGVLYGRYWGAQEDIRNLHFEVCSYAGIELCIARGWRRFEAGAGGGGHKYGRGFLPQVTYSAHEILLPGLDEAVRRAVEHEKRQLAAELAGMEGDLLKPR